MKKWKYAMESEQFLTIKKPIINLTQFGQKNNWLWTRQAVWGEIWKPTVEKNQINATNVTMPRLRQVIWKHIWKCIVEKSQTNTANVTLHVPRHLIWEDIWKHTVEKNKCNQCDFASSQAGNLRAHLKTHSGEKTNKCNAMWLCILLCKLFEDTF